MARERCRGERRPKEYEDHLAQQMQYWCHELDLNSLDPVPEAHLSERRTPPYGAAVVVQYLVRGTRPYLQRTPVVVPSADRDP